MITYFEEESTVNEVAHWIDVYSTNANYILFHLGYGDPVDINNPEDNKRYNFYSLTQEMVAELIEYFVTYEKPVWMGAEALNKPLAAGGKEYVWIDFQKDGNKVTILTGHYPIDKTPIDGSLFSYTVPAEIFVGMYQ